MSATAGGSKTEARNMNFGLCGKIEFKQSPFVGSTGVDALDFWSYRVPISDI